MPNDLPERQVPARVEAAFTPSALAGGDPGTNGQRTNGQRTNGQSTNGYGMNGHGVNGYGVTGGARAAGADSWLAALQEIQRQTSEAHAAYQHALADGHAAYLRSSEATLSGMMAALDGTGGLSPSNGRAAAPVPQALSAPPATPFSPFSPPASPPPLPALNFAPAPTAVIPQADPPTMVVAQRIEQPTAAVADTASVDLEQIVISIIADLTGYPVDMLQPDLELEHDLGIDSIKRVQILSRVRDRVPELPSIDPAELAALSSIGETVGYLRRQGTSRQASTSADTEGEPSPALS